MIDLLIFSPFTSPSLVSNGDFENDTVGWTANGTGTALSRITSDFKFGSAALKIDSGTTITQRMFTQLYAATVNGRQVVAHAYYKAGNVQTQGKIAAFQIYEPSGNLPLGSWVGPQFTDQWQLAYVKRTMSSTGILQLYVGNDSDGVTGDVQFWDGIGAMAGIALNDDIYPVNNFSTNVDIRNNEYEQSQRHKYYESNMMFGKRTINISGDILGNSSAEYIANRLMFSKYFIPADESNYPVGTLRGLFTGYPEPLDIDCTLDSWPEMPLQSKSPFAGPYNLTLKALYPAFQGIPRSISIPNTSFNTDVALPGLAGNFPAYPVITITGPWGHTFQITYNGIPFQLGQALQNALLLAGETITFDFKDRFMTENPVQGYASRLQFATNTWWGFDARESSTVRVTQSPGTTSASKVDISWRNAFMI